MNYAIARHNMVENQIRTNRVTHQDFFGAFAEVPREIFVPEHLAAIAYVDGELLISQGRYILEPMVLARLLQSAEIGPEDVILEIGCGTGYSTAILAKLASTVVAVE